MKPSRAKAVEHKCRQCMGEYADGKLDCEITHCALYHWMPYRRLEPDYTWSQCNPRSQSGKARVYTLSDERRAEIGAMLKKAKNRRSGK